MLLSVCSAIIMLFCKPILLWLKFKIYGGKKIQKKVVHKEKKEKAKIAELVISESK